jgi:hypothetical protein
MCFSICVVTFCNNFFLSYSCYMFRPFHVHVLFLNVRMIKDEVVPVSGYPAPLHKIVWGGGAGIDPPFLSSALMEVGGHLYALATLSPVPIV